MQLQLQLQLQLPLPLHNTTLHCTALHYTTPRHTTPHCTTLHHTTLHYITPHYTTTTATTTLLYTTLHYTTLHYPTLHYTTVITPPQIQLQLQYANYTTPQLQLHYTTTTTTAAPHHITSSSCGWGDPPGDHCNHCNYSKKHNSSHLSVHQWIRSAIRDSQQPTSPIGLLFLKLPPPPCAALLVLSYVLICSHISHIFP